jgi:TonB family protein
MLSFSVDEEGNVVPGTVETVNAQPPGYFERSALNAVRRMNFENTVNRLIEDVRYVFRYQLEERSGMFVAPVAQEAQFRELIPMRFITPDYPRFAEEQGLEGYVVVSFTVSETGTVSDISVIESQPVGVFDEQALIAAQRLRFEPRLVEDLPVRVEGVTYRFDWRLR